jgi:hypothetical protein
MPKKIRRRRIGILPIPFPVPLPLPVGYNVHPFPDGQECEFMMDGILYNGKSGNPEIDFTAA